MKYQIINHTDEQKLECEANSFHFRNYGHNDSPYVTWMRYDTYFNTMIVAFREMPILALEPDGTLWAYGQNEKAQLLEPGATIIRVKKGQADENKDQ